MQPFHYDAVARHKPRELEFVRRDAELLCRRGVKVIEDLEDPNLTTHFAQCVEEALGISLDAVDFDELDEQTRKQFQEFYNLFHIQYCTLLNFELSRKKVFYFDGLLLDRLLVTEAAVPSEFLRLPFPSCAFVIDYQPVLRVYREAFRLREHAEQCPLTIYLTELAKEDGLHLVFVGDSKDYETFRSAFFFKRSLLAAPGRSLEDALETEWPVGQGETVDSDRRFFQGGTRVFFRMLLNCILYLSSPTADLLASQSPVLATAADGSTRSHLARRYLKRVAAAQRGLHSRLNYVHVGGRIPVAPFRPYFHQEGVAGLGRLLIHKHLVRGHWRSQPYGPKGSLRKLIYVEPYWRGPDLGAVVAKPYDVKL